MVLVVVGKGSVGFILRGSTAFSGVLGPGLMLFKLRFKRQRFDTRSSVSFAVDQRLKQESFCTH